MGGMSIGHWLGFQMRVHWSWLIIFGLVTANLAYVFADLRPGWSIAGAIALAAGASLALFLSVLVHELSHALVARSRGIEVRDITLFIFGGAASFEREPPDAKSEFLTTVVGPVTSFVLGVATLGVAFAITPDAQLASVDAIEQLSPLQLAVLWLGQVNILLAVFNLLPGFPLDGGRIFRSAVWAISGSIVTATRWAARAGQAVAALLVVAGVAMVLGVQVPFFGSGVGGLWLVLIGLFLNAAAQAEWQQVMVDASLGDVRVSRLMRRDVGGVAPSTSVDELVHERMLGGGERAVPVLQGERLAGLACMQDVREVPRDAWETTAVEQVMTPRERLATATPDMPAVDALRELSQHGVDQLPVLSDGHLEGMLRRRDILDWLELERPWQRGGQRR